MPTVAELGRIQSGEGLSRKGPIFLAPLEAVKKALDFIETHSDTVISVSPYRPTGVIISSEEVCKGAIVFYRGLVGQKLNVFK